LVNISPTASQCAHPTRILVPVDDQFSRRVPDDLRRADDWTHGDASEPDRVGLKGLPVSAYETYTFDEDRLFFRNTPWSTALALWWGLGLVVVALAIWDGRAILGALGAIVIASAFWWTFQKVRDRRDASRIRDRFGPDGQELHPR
jgi:hypothetical protein